MVREKKLYVLKELFGSDVNRLVALLSDVCERQKRYRDYTRRELTTMIREVIACFPVYRTYVQAERGARSATATSRYVDEAIEAAKANRPEIDPDLLDFLRDLLLLRVKGSVESSLVMRFQQNTGPVMAKGLEDTVFYNFNRLVALNEVGGDPGRFGIPPAKFHEECLETQRRWATSMTTTTTHDTKRSEDVRARISLLSEIPEPLGRGRRALVRAQPPAQDRRPARPERRVPALPDPRRRLADRRRPGDRLHAQGRPARPRPTPPGPTANEAYEEALKAFVAGLLADREFVADLEGFVEPLIEPGRVNSLSQALIKLTAPGVPDIYQGNELWDMSLVDPDNRRPVDYDLRRQAPRRAGRGPDARGDPRPVRRGAAQALGDPPGPPPPQATARAVRPRGGLHARSRRPGPKADHVVAFGRGDGCVTVAPRLPLEARRRLGRHHDRPARRDVVERADRRDGRRGAGRGRRPARAVPGGAAGPRDA